MIRGAALMVVAVLVACSGRSSQNGSAGDGGDAATSSAGPSGSGTAMAGSGSTIAGTSSTSGGNEMAGGSAATEGGDSNTSGGAPAAGSAAGGADGEAGAASGEGGSGPVLECPSGCSAGTEPFCEGGGVTWVCFGPGPIDHQALIDGGCTDLATQVPRYCCPASFHPECQQ